MGILLIVLRVGLAVWVYLDCRKRWKPLVTTLLWTLATLAMPLVVVAYLLFGRGKAQTAYEIPLSHRRQGAVDVVAEVVRETKRCPRCGKEVLAEKYCSACGALLQ